MELVERKTKEKGYDTDIKRLLELDRERRELMSSVEALRQKRNSISSSMSPSTSLSPSPSSEDSVTDARRAKPEQSVIDEGKQLKIELAEREGYLETTNKEWMDLLKLVPNVTADDVPIGDESQSLEIKKFGDQKTSAVDHIDFAVKRDWLDFDRGAKVAGTKFYFLKGDLALLENAITQFALDFIVKKDFTLMIVPNMVNNRIATGAGFAPRSSKQSDEYFIEGEDLSLIATSEMPLTGYHADEIIDEKNLPLLYAGLSPCYRKEAGTYGKHAHGLFRVHQFNKLEMYAFTLPEASQEMHEKILAIEEELWQAIGIPYHIINIASGDLGAPAAKKYDLEYWSPVDQKYRELTSCSNCTDFQTRNLNIRVRRANGKIEVLHSLNGTAVSLARSLIAVIEHFQRDDGKLTVPEVLRPFLGGKEVL